MRETLSPVCWERCMDSSVLRCSGWLGSELPWGCCSVLSCQGSQVRHNHPCPAVPAAAESWPLLVPGDKELWMKEAGEAAVEPGNLLCFQGTVLSGNCLPH